MNHGSMSYDTCHLFLYYPSYPYGVPPLLYITVSGHTPHATEWRVVPCRPREAGRDTKSVCAHTPVTSPDCNSGPPKARARPRPAAGARGPRAAAGRGRGWHPTGHCTF